MQSLLLYGGSWLKILESWMQHFSLTSIQSAVKELLLRTAR
jgi:hypothetical protein